MGYTIQDFSIMMLIVFLGVFVLVYMLNNKPTSESIIGILVIVLAVTVLHLFVEQNIGSEWTMFITFIAIVATLVLQMLLFAINQAEPQNTFYIAPKNASESEAQYQVRVKKELEYYLFLIENYQKFQSKEQVLHPTDGESDSK